jgi:hypothetical protein
VPRKREFRKDHAAGYVVILHLQQIEALTRVAVAFGNRTRAFAPLASEKFL